MIDNQFRQGISKVTFLFNNTFCFCPLGASCIGLNYPSKSHIWYSKIILFRSLHTMAGSKKGEKAKEKDMVMEEEDEWETDDEVEEQLESEFIA